MDKIKESSGAHVSITPIGYVRSQRKKVEDDFWGGVESTIELLPSNFEVGSLAGLSDFSHAYVVFYMHEVDKDKIITSARHPRNNSAHPKVGIFSQRGKNRPNQIGLTCVRIKSVDADKLKLVVEELDAINGTPVLDIKPYIQQFGPRGEVCQPEWVDDVMRDYWRVS